MPGTGTGYGTPVSGGAGTGLDLAQPYPPTILSLGRYAQIMGLDPVHFMGGLTPSLNPQIHPSSGCSAVWHKYDWQNHDQVSLMQIALLIHEAEQQIAEVTGYWPGPYWVEEEIHDYPRPFLRDAYGKGVDVRDRLKSVNARWGKYITAGQRAVTLVATATVAGGTLAYTDEDSDGFYETATVQAATTVTNVNELKLYFTGTGGQIEWEVRPIRSKAISGGIVTFVLDSQFLINPELYELPPDSDGNYEYIDVSTTANFVTSVDVYREYADSTSPSAVFYWSSDTAASNVLGGVCPTCGIIGCTACNYDTQNGCLVARSAINSQLVVYPASYDAVAGTWSKIAWTSCIEPDMVKVHYRSGNQSQEFLSGRSFDPLSLFWARVIAWLATARLDRPVCDCGSFKSNVDNLTRDMTHNLPNDTFYVTANMIDNNPFGTRAGEIMAWRAIIKTVRDKRSTYAVV